MIPQGWDVDGPDVPPAHVQGQKVFGGDSFLGSIRLGEIGRVEQARNLRRCALEAGKTSTPKTENLKHLTYLHAESGMRNKSKLGHL